MMNIYFRLNSALNKEFEKKRPAWLGNGKEL